MLNSASTVTSTFGRRSRLKKFLFGTRVKHLIPLASFTAMCLLFSFSVVDAHDGTTIEVPKLKKPIVIDGDLSDLASQAWSSGVWDLDRMKAQSWYVENPWPMDIFDSGEEPPGTANTRADITGEYFMAWDDNGIYLAVQATDNVHDVTAEVDTPWGWYLKDGCSWFIDVPHDGDGAMTSVGDHVFSFVADDTYPPNSTWWRHGDPSAPEITEVWRGGQRGWRMSPSWLEEPGHWWWQYQVKRNGSGDAGYAIEAFVPFGQHWMKTPKPGDTVGLMIVHTDPDGGRKPFGGQLQLFGSGDHDGTWADMIFTE
tara:strand:- start:135 stop:1070 length:936 start_codon:yes stop_codon:yes gene_type:complete